MLLDPLIEFGTGNGYCTRHENQCAKLDHCRLTKPRDVAGKLWVRLPEALAMSSIFSATVYEYFFKKIFYLVFVVVYVVCLLFHATFACGCIFLVYVFVVNCVCVAMFSVCVCSSAEE